MTAFLIICVFLVALYPVLSFVRPTTPIVLQIPFNSSSTNSGWVIDPTITQMAKSIGDNAWIPVIIRFNNYIDTSMIEELENLTYLKVRCTAQGDPLVVNLGDIHAIGCEIQGYNNLEEFTKQYQNEILYVENSSEQQLSPDAMINETSYMLQTNNSGGTNGGSCQINDIQQQQEIKWWVSITQAPEVWDSQVNGQNITGQGTSIAFLDGGINDWEFNTPAGLYYKNGTSGVILDINGFTGMVYNIPLNTSYNPVPDTYPAGVPHGTAVAAAAAGGNNFGIAPGANIINIYVINQDFTYDPTNVMYWMGWCVANRDNYNISAINFSDGTTDPLYESQTLTDMINYIQQYCGIVVCLAAGNSANQIRTIAYPGTAEYAITSGSCNDLGLPSSLTSFGPSWDGSPKPELLAPAAGGYTSLSAPATAGVVALLAQTCEALNISRDEWSLRIRAAIIRGASMNQILLPDWNPASGYGLLNALDSFQQISNTSSWSEHVEVATWPYTFASPDGVYIILLGPIALTVYYWNVRVTVECDGQDTGPYLVGVQGFQPIGSLATIGNLQGAWIMTMGQKNSIDYEVFSLTPNVFFPPAVVGWS
jgi:hypothetical protein